MKNNSQCNKTHTQTPSSNNVMVLAIPSEHPRLCFARTVFSVSLSFLSVSLL